MGEFILGGIFLFMFLAMGPASVIWEGSGILGKLLAVVIFCIGTTVAMWLTSV